MEQITADTYYTAILPGIAIALPVLYVALAILWNRKWVPRQRQRGQATPPFGKVVGDYLSIGFKESTFSLLPKKVDNPKLRSLLSLKTINWLLVIATIAMLGTYANDIWVNAWIPVVALLLSVWVAASPLINARKAVLSRMFSVAGTVFRYGRGSELTPWRFIKIKKWQGQTPTEIHISIPPEYDASSPVSRDGFERHFNGTVTDENTWVYEWQSAKGVVIARPIADIPTMVPYEGSEKYKWHQIPLGMGVNGDVVVDLTLAPHMLITGVTGSGKSVLQRNLIFHTIQHNDMWRFLGVDIKRVELSPFKKYQQTVMGIGTNLEDGVDIVRYVKRVMEKRYEKMEAMGINNFKDMKDESGKTDYAIMLMIDEAYMFMAPTGNKSDEGKAHDQLHAEASSMLGEIARLGRAAGIHLVMATQRPDAKVIYGELKLNLPIRIAAGRLDSTASAMTLDTAAATFLPAIKGRGIVSVYGEAQQFQGYYADQDWIDKWLEQHPGVEPTLFPGAGKGDQLDSTPGDLGEIMEAGGFDFEDEQSDYDVNAETGETDSPLEMVKEFIPMPEEVPAPQVDNDFDPAPADFTHGVDVPLPGLEDENLPALAQPVQTPPAPAQSVPEATGSQSSEDDIDPELLKLIQESWEAGESDKPVIQVEQPNTPQQPSSLPVPPAKPLPTLGGGLPVPKPAGKLPPLPPIPKPPTR